jgi:uncharacterized protein YcfJ
MTTPVLKKSPRTHARRNPVSGALRVHPIGTGVGAAVGGLAAGALVGTGAGPAGTIVGAVIGALAGGVAGRGIAEVIEPSAEDDYWHQDPWSLQFMTVNSKFEETESELKRD